jgi:hypothetical protein
LVEETGGPGENHRPVASHWQTLSHNVVHLTLIEIRTVLAVYIWLSCLYVLTFYFLFFVVYVLFSCLYGQFAYISLWCLCFMTRHFGGIFWLFKHVFHSHISGLDFFF